MERSAPPWALHARWLPIALLCLVALIPMWRIFTGDIFLPLDIVPHLHPWRFSYERVAVNNPTNSDVIQQVYPRRLVANAFLRQGAWPLWNPTILTGTPLLADGQLALFYPGTLLFLALPLAHAFGVYALLHELLAALGTYAFARRLKLGPWAAALAGVCYMWSGYILTWLQFPHHSGAAAMLPWCFWAVDRACDAPRLRRWLVAGLTLAMPLLIQIQLAFYIYVGVGCYLLWRLGQTAGWTARLRLASGFGLAVVLALGLSAVQLVPQIALSAQGQRVEQVSGPASSENQFISLLRLLLPLVGGKPREPAPAWGPALIQAPQSYTGLAPLALAVIALLMSRHRATTFFGLLAIGSCALAIGSPLLRLFIALVPAYRQFADHSRWFLLWGFAVAILAAMGLDQLWGNRSSPKTGWLVVFNRLLLGLTAAGLGVWLWRHLALFTPRSRYGEYITLIRQQPLGVPVLIAAVTAALLALSTLRRLPRIVPPALLLAVTIGDLLWYGGGYNTFTNPALFKPTADLVAALPQAATQSDGILYPPTRQVAYLQAQAPPFRIIGGDYPVFLPNLATAFGLEDVRGYQSLYLARYNRLARLIDGRDYTRLAGEGGGSLRPYLTSAYTHRRLLDMLNVKFFLFPPGSKNPPLYQPLELVQQSDEGTLYRNPRALPRAWLVHQAEAIADDDAQLARMARPDFDPATSAVLPADPPELRPAAAPEPVPTVEYAPNRLRVRAEASAPALLIVSDAYTSDWQVAVDGRPATALRANYALRGVWLPAGTHDVDFTYRPRSFLIGGLVSLAALLALLLYFVSTARSVRDRLGPRRTSRV
jgi:hypothetical protein